MVYCSSALAGDNTDKQIIESALRETRDIISRELFGHYDITNLAVVKIEALQGRIQLGHDYGLVTVTLTFAAKRNTTKHPNLNPDMFEPASAMCQGWLYLHCGVPAGHVFDGTLRLLQRSTERDRGGRFRRIGAQEGSMRFTATYSWKGGKRKDMCCSPNSASANNTLDRTRATTAGTG
jgi:hypothetical protein